MSAIGFDVRTAQLTPDTYVVSVTGEIDMYTSPSLERELAWVLDAGGRKAVIDLAEVSFIDSTTLSVLLKALSRFNRRGGSLVLVSSDRRILRTLEITGLNFRLVVEETLSDAVDRLSRAGNAPSLDGSRPQLEDGLT